MQGINNVLQIYNSLTRKKEPFTPIEGNNVRMYVCGNTVYDHSHLGHASTMVAFDVVARYLRARGYDLTYVRNITDIDDKIIRRAAENGEPYAELTRRMIESMDEDAAALGIQKPDEEPKATEFIDGMLDMISGLIEKGYAYAPGNGDVYYRVRKFEGYGKLSGKVIEELESGARITVGEDKEDALDFVLWKGAKEGEPSWDSPWGKGRPGWHIECSAMCKHCLGDTFDIHGGGPDLPFPHHENEIAQSEAANGAEFARYWMHSGALRMGKEKMSKSLGNFFTVKQILENYPAEVVRYLLISSHYRSHTNYSEESLKEAGVRLERLYTSLKGLDVDDVKALENDDLEQRFFKAMDDDFNTPEALAVLFDGVRRLNTERAVDEQSALPLAALLRKLGGILGILQRDAETFLKSGSDVNEAWIEEMIQKRKDAKKARDFAESDRIRDELASQGVILQDSREGTTWRIER
ncbi:cysteine--tRNA ligase [Endozoicomonas sp. (ex Bugula neritina AB1)]|nr:cysteine--tRNA ligase [Endozoicomonas sp. (ex Bugula neritina AB1)]